MRPRWTTIRRWPTIEVRRPTWCLRCSPSTAGCRRQRHAAAPSVGGCVESMVFTRVTPVKARGAPERMRASEATVTAIRPSNAPSQAADSSDSSSESDPHPRTAKSTKMKCLMKPWCRRATAMRKRTTTKLASNATTKPTAANLDGSPSSS